MPALTLSSLAAITHLMLCTSAPYTGLEPIPGTEFSLQGNRTVVLEEEVGRGLDGVVFRASMRDEICGLEETVAVKVSASSIPIPRTPGAVGANEMSRYRALKEAYDLPLELRGPELALLEHTLNCAQEDSEREICRYHRTLREIAAFRAIEAIQPYLPERFQVPSYRGATFVRSDEHPHTRTGAIVMDLVQDTVTFREYLTTLRSEPPAMQKYAALALLRTIGQGLNTLAEHGIYQMDPHPRQFLVSTDGNCTVTMIDLQRVALMRHRSLQDPRTGFAFDQRYSLRLGWLPERNPLSEDELRRNLASDFGGKLIGEVKIALFDQAETLWMKELCRVGDELMGNVRGLVEAIRVIDLLR